MDDIDETLDALAARGVRFERFDGLEPDKDSVFRENGPYIAWFKDPSGKSCPFYRSGSNRFRPAG